MTNREWMLLIAKEFNVSNSVAKEMLHAMMEVKKVKEASYKPSEVYFDNKDDYIKYLRSSGWGDDEIEEEMDFIRRHTKISS